MKRAAVVLLAGWSAVACAARGHLATPEEMARLRETTGLVTSGRITLQGPAGRFSTRVVLGVARPDSLRIEIPAGAGLRFLLVARDGRLRADLPQDDAMFEGPATNEVMDRLFGIDVDPKALVAAILGSPPATFSADWRFDRARPVRITLRDARGSKLTLNLDDPETEAPAERAFTFGPPRGESWTLEEMSSRLGLKR